MSKILPKSLLAILALSMGFAAHAFLQSDQDALASPERIEQLTQLAAVCPELAFQVAHVLDLNEGVLSNDAASGLIAENQRCHQYHQQLSDVARYRLAYAALRAVVAQNVPVSERHYPDAKPATILKLSLHPAHSLAQSEHP
jgi:hypothetical protein